MFGGKNMFEMSLCNKNMLCVDCNDTKCLGAGEIISDCPKYHCDRESGHINDCETCNFIKQFQKNMRKEYGYDME